MSREKHHKRDHSQQVQCPKGSEDLEVTEAATKESEDAIQGLQAEARSAKDKYLRALADFENTRKRLEREKEEFAKFAGESIVRELLPIVDSLDQALVALDKQADPEVMAKGIQLIYRQLLGLLERDKVKRIKTVGEMFDPNQHEAVEHVETTDNQADGAILEEVQVGYTMHGKVIRSALVKVAKRTEETSEEQQAE